MQVAIRTMRGENHKSENIQIDGDFAEFNL